MALLVVVGAAAAFLVQQISGVRENLQEVMVLAPRLLTALEEGDIEVARSVVSSLEEQASAARATSSGILWKVASTVPIAGANFRAVSEVTVSAEDIAVRALDPLINSFDVLNSGALSPVNGRIDVVRLQEAEPDISAAASTFHLSYERLASIDLTRLVPEIAEPLASATEQLRSADVALKTASSGAKLLPGLLGADGERNYLVLVQNSAEARATGGIPGALAILTADAGQVTMGEQSSASAVGTFRPPLSVDEEQVSLFTARLGTQMQNVNLTPDFPTAAETAKRMWEQRHSGQNIDGVLAVDPVVLSELLGATGPVRLSDERTLALVENTTLPTELTKDNVVPTLLSDVYREIEIPETQDAYFAAVAVQIFGAFMEGQSGGNGKILQALSSSAQEHRLLLWSDHQGEQEIIATTNMHGSVTGADSGGAAFGVYFNDGTGAKMDYYVSRTVQLQVCQSDESNQVTVRSTITNNAPAVAAEQLPAYVTGAGVFGVEPGHIQTNYVFYGPAQALTETATVNGKHTPIGSGRHGQRPVGTVTLELGPGESAEVDVLFSHVVQDSEPTVRVTPTTEPMSKVILPHKRSCD